MDSIMRPQVGVGVIVLRGNKVLLGKRKGSHGESTWAFPGGHLEWHEMIMNCARREVKEETGLDVLLLNVGHYTNDIFEKEGKHYVTLYLTALSQEGEPRVMEPNKCDEWGWFLWGDFPEPLFIPVRNLVRLGYNPFHHLGLLVANTEGDIL